MAAESSPSDPGNRRRGRAVGGIVATGFALVIWTNSTGHRSSSITLVTVTLGSLAFVAANAFVGGWAGMEIGRRVTGGGVQYGVFSSWIALWLFALLGMASELAAGRKHGLEVIGSGFSVLFFGCVPATLTGVVAGLLLSKLVTRPMHQTGRG